MDRPGYLTAAQVAEKYGMSRFTIYRRRNEGRLKAYKFVGDPKTYWSDDELKKLSGPQAEPEQRWRRETLD